MLGLVFFELLEDSVALFERYFAVILERPKAAELMLQDFDALDPLAKDDGLLATGGDFFQVGFESFELAAGAGRGIEVADLLEAEDKFKDVLDRDFIAQLVELEDAFVLRHLVTGPL